MDVSVQASNRVVGVDGGEAPGGGEGAWRVVVWLEADADVPQVHVVVQGRTPCTALAPHTKTQQSSSIDLALPLTVSGEHICVGQARIDAGEVPYVPLYAVPRSQHMQVHELIWQTFRRWVVLHAAQLEGHLLSGAEPSEPGALSERWVGLAGETA